MIFLRTLLLTMKLHFTNPCVPSGQVQVITSKVFQLPSWLGKLLQNIWVTDTMWTKEKSMCRVHLIKGSFSLYHHLDTYPIYIVMIVERFKKKKVVNWRRFVLNAFYIGKMLKMDHNSIFFYLRVNYTYAYPFGDIETCNPFKFKQKKEYRSFLQSHKYDLWKYRYQCCMVKDKT